MDQVQINVLCVKPATTSIISSISLQRSISFFGKGGGGSNLHKVN